jgi:molybdenum cofactor cytidylyltransferase
MSEKPAIRRIGVIVAAGRGGRMGGRKQLTPWQSPDGDAKPLVAAAYDAISPICDSMVVVVGHDADAVAAALGDRPFERALGDADEPMFESIRTGLKAARRLDTKAYVVLQPGDHPEVSAATLELLRDWSLKRPVRAVIPEYGGRGGHPVLIPPDLVAQLAQSECPDGLGQFWLDHQQVCERVSVNDAGVVRDIDTPADLG